MDDRQFDILAAGELNVDLILDQLHLPPEFDKEQKADEMNLVMGSSTAIFASNSALLGRKVVFAGKTGMDMFGEFVLSQLKNSGVNTDYIIRNDRIKTGATVIMRHLNRQMMVTYPGAMETFTVDEIPENLFPQCRHLHTSSIFFQPGIRAGLNTLFEKAKNYGMTTSLDTQWDPEEKWEFNLESILPFTDFLMPNEQELLHLTSSGDLHEAFDKLSNFGTTVVVKRGKKGATMLHNGKIDTLPAENVSDIADTVGAGDSFNAGFLNSFLNGDSLLECLKAGNRIAAISLTSAGGTRGVETYRNSRKS